MMQLPKLLLCLFILSLGAVLCERLHAQSHLAVAPQHPVYTLLELAEIKGILPWLPQSKPYPASTLEFYLDQITANARFIQRFALYEQELVRAFRQQFVTQQGTMIDRQSPDAAADSFCFWSGVDYPTAGGNFLWGVNEESEIRLNFNQLDAWHIYNGVRLYLAGDLGDKLSYYGNFGFTFDKVGTDSFAPYSFTKQWDGYHLNFSEQRYSFDGVEPAPFFSFILENEITGLLFNDQVMLRFARLRREWSVGEGSLYLSASARPFEGIDLQARLLHWFNFGYALGSLGNWFEEVKLKPSANPPPDSDTPTFQKMFTLQLLEFFPVNWLYMSVASTAIWGKRFELGYMMPLMYPVIHQNLHGDFDNVGEAVNLAVRIPGYAKLYFTFYADEMEFTSLSELFKRPRNMLAYQAGLKVPLPILPLALLTFQYTKIEPFVYAHYTEDGVSALDHPVDLSYTHDGENLGYRLPPNSDEFLLKVVSLFHPQWLAFGQLQLIRHGTNDPNIPLQNAIYGDVNVPFNYDLRDLYPDKHFLHDGYYDWNFVSTIGAQFSPAAFPVTIGLDFSLAYTWWVMNQTGLPRPEATWRTILGFTLSLFR